MQFIVSSGPAKDRTYLAREPDEHDGAMQKVGPDHVLCPSPHPARRFNMMGALGAAIALAVRNMDPSVRITRAVPDASGSQLGLGISR